MQFDRPEYRGKYLRPFSTAVDFFGVRVAILIKDPIFPLVFNSYPLCRVVLLF